MTVDNKRGAQQSTSSGAVDANKQAQMNAVWQRIEKKQAESHKDKLDMERKDRNKRLCKRLAIVGCVVLVVALIITGVCLFTDVDDSLINELKYGDTKIESASQAMELAENGNANQVIYWYDKKAKEAADNKTKAEIYLELVSVIATPSDTVQYSDDVLQTALEYALKAEELDPSIGSAIKLSTVYEMMGDEENTKKYNEIAQQRMDDSGESPEAIGGQNAE